MTDTANKTVLISGAGCGFGQHMVQQFRAAGAKLILTEFTDQALGGPEDAAGEDLVVSVAADL